jgi:hypothetical protein
MLETVIGPVRIERLAYRAPGVGNLHPADAALNLPVERHSHGLRKLSALEGPRGSFDGAVDAIWRQTGQRLGKRQAEEICSLAAMVFEDFYATRRPARTKTGDLLVLSADGKGIVAPRRATYRDRPAGGARRARNQSRGSSARISPTASGWRRSARSTTPPRRPRRGRHPALGPAGGV